MSNQPTDSTVPFTSIHRIQADGVTVFYREAGPRDAPVVLLLHGFPTSSFQYRHLIPRLADRYRVIAPDLPGFGFTVVPPERNYTYTFDTLSKTLIALNASPQSSRRMAMLMRKASAIPGLPSSGTGASPRSRIATPSAAR
jgi:pimeloyl-ACP methyl ester carboxylesterase